MRWTPARKASSSWVSPAPSRSRRRFAEKRSATECHPDRPRRDGAEADPAPPTRRRRAVGRPRRPRAAGELDQGRGEGHPLPPLVEGDLGAVDARAVGEVLLGEVEELPSPSDPSPELLGDASVERLHQPSRKPRAAIWRAGLTGTRRSPWRRISPAQPSPRTAISKASASPRSSGSRTRARRASSIGHQAPGARPAARRGPGPAVLRMQPVGRGHRGVPRSGTPNYVGRAWEFTLLCHAPGCLRSAGALFVCL